jgi:hypothetical protein
MARANGTPAAATRRQKPAISSPSLRPINPASVTQALTALQAVSSMKGPFPLGYPIFLETLKRGILSIL